MKKKEHCRRNFEKTYLCDKFHCINGQMLYTDLKFSEKITQLMNSYYNGLITNEEVIKELLKTHRRLQNCITMVKSWKTTQEELALRCSDKAGKHKGLLSK